MNVDDRCRAAAAGAVLIGVICLAGVGPAKATGVCGANNNFVPIADPTASGGITCIPPRPITSSDVAKNPRLFNAYAEQRVFNDAWHRMFTSDDPFIDFTTIHDNGAQITSASGAASSSIPGSRTTDVGGGASSAFNLSHTFNLSGNQRLVVGGAARYDSLRTTFGPDSSAPGLASAGAVNESAFSVAGMARYYVGTTYLGVLVAGNWGRDSLSDNLTPATGSFHTSGYGDGISAGHTFTLFDSRSVDTRVVPTKAPPKPIGGYAVELDVSGHLDYNWAKADGFTDSSGFVWGDQNLRYWTAGAQAQLTWIIPTPQLTWRPFLAATVSSDFSYSNTVDIPAQTGALADTLFIGGPQTFGGARAGISAQAKNGIIVGAQAFYQRSSEYSVTGGQVFLRYQPPPVN